MARQRSTRDHIVDANKVMIVCGRCNYDKKGKSLGQWLARLQKAKDPRHERIAALIKEMGLPNRRDRLRASVIRGEKLNNADNQ